MPKDSLKTRLEIAKNKLSKKNLYKNQEAPSSIGTAFKLSTELVSAVAVGTIIGFILDKTFGTKRLSSQYLCLCYSVICLE